MRYTKLTGSGLNHICGKRLSAIHAGSTVLLTMLLAMLASPLYADADLRVRVFERGGTQPLAGVSVCLGTPARISQFGSSQTDAEGYAVFAGVPQAPLVVTVSRPGYMGEQQSLVTSNIERMLVISLPTGGGGPECIREDKSVLSYTGGLQVGSFNVRQRGADGSREVILGHSVNREPTHYRVSEDPRFSDADWLPYVPEPVYMPSSGAGSKVIYFQVRRYSTMNGADLEARSTVMQDVIVVR